MDIGLGKSGEPLNPAQEVVFQFGPMFYRSGALPFVEALVRAYLGSIGGASGRHVETFPGRDSDGASAPVDPLSAARTAAPQTPTTAGTVRTHLIIAEVQLQRDTRPARWAASCLGQVVQLPPCLLTNDGVVVGAAGIGRRPQAACAAVGLVLSSGDDSFFFRRDTRVGGRLWLL